MPKFSLIKNNRAVPPLPAKTLDDWRAFLRNFTYKPGWGFAAHVLVDGFLRIHIEVSTANAYNTTEPVTVNGNYPIDDCFTDDDMVDELAKAILIVEHHEFGEFFVVKGSRPFNPHNPASRPLPSQLPPTITTPFGGG